MYLPSRWELPQDHQWIGVWWFWGWFLSDFDFGMRPSYTIVFLPKLWMSDQGNKEQGSGHSMIWTARVLTPHLPFLFTDLPSRKEADLSWAQSMCGTGAKFWKSESSLCGVTNQSEGVSCVFFCFCSYFPFLWVWAHSPLDLAMGPLRSIRSFLKRVGGVQISPSSVPLGGTVSLFPTYCLFVLFYFWVAEWTHCLSKQSSLSSFLRLLASWPIDQVVG